MLRVVQFAKKVAKIENQNISTAPSPYSRVPNKQGVPNKLVGVEIFSYQYEKFPKVRLGGGWKGAKNDYLGQ